MVRAEFFTEDIPLFEKIEAKTLTLGTGMVRVDFFTTKRAVSATIVKKTLVALTAQVGTVKLWLHKNLCKPNGLKTV